MMATVLEGLSSEVTTRPDREPVSVIVMVTERPAPLGGLYQEFAAPLKAAGRTFEFVFAVEPWAAELTGPLKDLAAQGEPIRVIETGQALGESALLKLAAAEAVGSIVVTLPAYYRVEAPAILQLVRRVEEGVDLAVARRWPRNDSWVNRLQNRVFHALLPAMGRVRIRDTACGVRATRRELLNELPLYGDFHRFLPLFALRDGYHVEELDVPQHPRDRHGRVYLPSTYARRIIDVLGVFFLIRFTYKPLRFFGLAGIASGLLGVLLLSVLTVQRLAGKGLADRPLLLLGVLLVVMGAQAIALGLIGEIIVHLNAGRTKPYRVRRSGVAATGATGSRT
jgi:hypothetical protein